jgi:uncharacterized protein
MLLDLREIIGVPGAKLKFDYAPDLTDAAFDPFTGVVGTSRAVGAVTNSAGALSFAADVDATFSCVCSRCLKEFEYPIRKRVSANLTEDELAGDEPGMFYIDGARIDADEVIVTDIILDAQQSPLCREDCRGLCEKCGADLNEGACGCKAETDPRLAVLGQLLEDF